MAEDTLQALRAIVGSDHAFGTGDSRSGAYRRFERLLAGEIAAFAMPADVEQVQAIMRLAKDRDLAIVNLPNAAGNGAVAWHGNGAAVALDLQRMNRIIEINTHSAYALIEAGVSYRQLYEHLQREQIPFWIDCDRNGANSVAGSISARGVGYTPYGDHMLMQCGMEVVLGDGEVVRTGMGALPKSNTWQLFKYSFGPYVDGLFTQSDMAVITKVGLWVMPAPPAYSPFKVSLEHESDLGHAVEILREFKINAVIPNTVVIAHAHLEAAPYTQRGDFEQSGSIVPEALRMATGLGTWNVYGALYGMPEIVDMTRPMIQEALGSIEGARISGPSKDTDDAIWQDRQRLMRGAPAQKGLDFSEWGGSDYLSLSVAAPIEGEHAMRLHGIVADTVSREGFDYLAEYLLTWRTLIKRVYLPYDAQTPQSFEKATAAAKSLVGTLQASGYGVIDESPELRSIVDIANAESGLSDLVGRVRQALTT